MTVWLSRSNVPLVAHSTPLAALPGPTGTHIVSLMKPFFNNRPGLYEAYFVT